MRRISLRWLIAGAVFGGMGFVYNLMALGAIIDGVNVGREWAEIGVVLCPWIVPLRSIWSIFASNCLLYALVFAGFRFACLGLRRRAILK